MKHGYFWLKRLHSFSGLILSVAFVLCFLIPNSAIFSGAQNYNLFALISEKIPLINELEFVLIFLPLIFHAAFGLSFVYNSQFNILAYGTYRNWMYTLQRFTGILIIPFLAYHIYATRVVFAFSDKYADYSYMQKILAPTWVKIFYMIGIFSTAFHIGNGISSALAKWGITISNHSRDVVSMTMWGMTLVIMLWGFAIVLAF